MKTRLAVAMAMAFTLAIPAWSQRGEPQRGAEPRAAEPQHPVEQPRANQGRIPEPPPKREPGAKPETERGDGGRINNTPHVANNHWYGHDRPNDKRFVLAHPFEHGHFERFGPSYRYSVVRIDPGLHRFWLPGGFFFDIAAWDWALAADWCWTCGDDFVVYEDPDHPGWYLLYNLQTGAYVHVLYMGA